jgi:hypothetical protein
MQNDGFGFGMCCNPKLPAGCPSLALGKLLAIWHSVAVLLY